MKPKTQSFSSTGFQRRINYRMMPLLELVRRIVHGSDRDALKELHDNRMLFRYEHEEALLLVDYILAIGQGILARRWCGYDDTTLEQAINLTVDKFFNLPGEAPNCEHPGRRGPHCFYYFGAFLDYATAKLKTEPPANAIEEEMTVAEMLRRLAMRHFYLSCLESKRRVQKLVRRYIWKLNGNTLYLWLPITLPGQQCQKWLEANIPDLDPARVGEQDRVQAVVNLLLGRRRIFSLSDLEVLGERLPPSSHSLPSMIDEQISVDGLADTVAAEKAENIKRQRPAIRRLGEDKLKQLVQTVFTELAYGSYEEKRIAACFELSRATFSRFAGSRWNHNCKVPIVTSVPDLWRNTAQTLAGHSDFVIAAQKAGVWKRVSAVLDAGSGGRGI